MPVCTSAYTAVVFIQLSKYKEFQTLLSLVLLLLAAMCLVKDQDSLKLNPASSNHHPPEDINTLKKHSITPLNMLLTNLTSLFLKFSKSHERLVRNSGIVI